MASLHPGHPWDLSELKQASGQCSPGAWAGSGEAPVSFGTWGMEL